jgi:hypothetical protein
MTFAWYGHLKYRNEALWKVIMVSWGIAFFEYCFQVPANRIGSYQFNAAQLKTIPRDHHAFDLPGVFGVLSRRQVQMEPRRGFRIDHGCGVFHLSKVVRISGCDSGHARGRPDEHILPSREMQERRRLQRNFDRLGHGVARKLRLSLLQRPGAMMNFASNEAVIAVERIKTVAFRQEMFECALLRKK